MLCKNLGHNLIEARRQRGWTQYDLSRKSGIPRSTLARIEAFESNPELKTLEQLSLAMNLPAEDLLMRPKSRVKFLKDMEIKGKSMGVGEGAATFFNLLPDEIPGLVIDRMEFNGDRRVAGTPHLRGTQEYLHIIQGKIALVLRDGGTWRLQKGDVLAFSGDQPHSYTNLIKGKSIAVSVVVRSPEGV